MGATAATDGAANGSEIASASASVIGRGLRTESSGLPRKTNSRFVPMPLIEPVMDASAPRPTASMAITAATPITIPNTVRPDLSLFPLIDSSASRKACAMLIASHPKRRRADG